MKDPSTWVHRAESIEGGHYDIAMHERERATQGFSTYDWWNFNSYLSFVITGGLKKFLADGNGYPGAFESVDEWNVILEKMIAGFEQAEALSNGYEMPTPEQSAVVDEGFALFAKWYGHLWD